MSKATTILEDGSEWKVCSRCGNEAMELVDIHDDVDGEYRRNTWVCHHCGNEEQETFDLDLGFDYHHSVDRDIEYCLKHTDCEEMG